LPGGLDTAGPAPASGCSRDGPDAVWEFHPAPARLRWRSTPRERRLKALEEENRRLKKLVADQALDVQILKEVLAKKS
jgi:ATP:corrinoid adenosyltransferase